MEKRQTIAYLAQDKDEEMLLARLYERIMMGVQRNIPVSTCFLSAREQSLLRQLLPHEPLIFFGGAEGAERCVCCWIPEYLDETWLHSEDAPVAAIRAEYFAADKISHRDVLGALMGCGIKRETVGDIIMGEGAFDLMLLPEIVPYVLQNLTSAGRTKLHLTQIALLEVEPIQPNLKEVRSTVSTPRLDAVIASGFSLSRGRAVDLISSGRVELDHAACLKADKLVEAGSVVSVRGLGKLKLEEISGKTKKGRTGVIISRFV
ncbi:MAG: RNA-binding protein [Oscillospiraceae bacterium]|nr:RNA-binding protein [Oscillospiraceae bacterium]